MKWIFIAAIKFYQIFVSPLLGKNCRFFPSCSEYALISFERFGLFRAFYLMLKRLIRCHPFCSGGIDLVPEVHK